MTRPSRRKYRLRSLVIFDPKCQNLHPSFFFSFFFFLEIKYDYDTWSVTFSFFFSILFFMYGNSKGEKNTIVYRCVAVASRLFFLSTPLHPRSIPIFKISVGLSVSGHAWRINIVHK